MYHDLDVEIMFRGFGMQIVESGFAGPLELLSVCLDVIFLRKHGQSDLTKFSVYHVQVDDMRPYANMPVVFQPLDSGWNSCLRDDGRDVAFLQVGLAVGRSCHSLTHSITHSLPSP